MEYDKTLMLKSNSRQNCKHSMLLLSAPHHYHIQESPMQAGTDAMYKTTDRMGTGLPNTPKTLKAKKMYAGINQIMCIAR